MSDINLDFNVQTSNIQVVVDTNEITFTPTDIQLTLAQAILSPGGTNGELQYNNAGIIGGVANTNYDGSNLTLGNVSNVKITGGVNGYFLQTDGTGNLAWAIAGGGGNGSPGGSNTQIQYNDNGNFGGNAGFTFNEVTGNVNIPGNLIVAQTLTGNGSGLSSITGANVTGSVANATYANNAGNATIATSATTAGTVTTNAQPNITSVGTLTGLSVDGTTSVYEAIENVAIIGAQTGTYNFDMLDGSIQYSTANATANIVLNFRGNSATTTNSMLPNAKSITSTYIITNGASPYTISSITIDSNAQTIKWVNGITPTPFANSSTAYTFTIVKTATTPTYQVFASATRYS